MAKNTDWIFVIPRKDILILKNIIPEFVIISKLAVFPDFELTSLIILEKRLHSSLGEWIRYSYSLTTKIAHEPNETNSWGLPSW